MNITRSLSTFLLLSTASLAQNVPVSINPIGDGSFHNVTGPDSTTRTIYTPDRGQTFGGANAAGGGYQGTGVYHPTGNSITTPGTAIPVPVPPIH
jgi:hypothetical protein